MAVTETKPIKYPIMDEAHAHDALAQVSTNGTLEEKAAVVRAIHMKYPNIEIDGIMLRHARRSGG